MAKTTQADTRSVSVPQDLAVPVRLAASALINFTRTRVDLVRRWYHAVREWVFERQVRATACSRTPRRTAGSWTAAGGGLLLAAALAVLAVWAGQGAPGWQDAWGWARAHGLVVVLGAAAVVAAMLAVRRVLPVSHTKTGQRGVRPISVWLALGAVAVVVGMTWAAYVWLSNRVLAPAPGPGQAPPVSGTTPAVGNIGIVSVQLELVKVVITIAGAAGAAMVLWLTARKQWLGERAQVHTEDDARERRVTELYTKAADKLGADSDPVERLTALYSLERLAQANPDQRQVIVNIICAYLRMPFTPPASASALRGLGLRRRRPAVITAAAPPHPVESVSTTRRRQELEVRLTAQQLLVTHLRPDRTAWGTIRNVTFWPAVDLALAGATLIDFDLSRCEVAMARFDRATFTGSTDFGHTRFCGNVEFGEARFVGNVWFGKARFVGDAGFGEARFVGNTRFDEARFVGGARFDKVKFTGNARFHKVQFAGHAGFGEAHFAGDAWFNKVQFAGNAWFNEAHFADAGFSEVQFAGHAGFGEAHFAGDAWFDEAHFADDVRFGKAHFVGNAWFGKAHFVGNAWFGKARIEGEARFNEAHFAGNAWFPKAQFAGDAWFDEAHFAGDAWFNDAHFARDAGFDKARIEGEARFNEARFEGNARFGKTQFKGSAGFDEAHFKDIAGFAEAQFADVWFGAVRFSGQIEFEGARGTDRIPDWGFVITACPRPVLVHLPDGPGWVCTTPGCTPNQTSG